MRIIDSSNHSICPYSIILVSILYFKLTEFAVAQVEIRHLTPDSTGPCDRWRMPSFDSQFGPFIVDVDGYGRLEL